MRWSQGVWSEERFTQAANATGRYFAIPYGPSGTAPTDDVRAFELYFERLEAAGLGRLKRPDLLLFAASDRPDVDNLLAALGGVEELPFTPESDANITALLAASVCAIECENSLWVGRQMPDYGKPLTPQKRLSGLPGLKKNAVVPTVIIKDEDREFLKRWQSERGVPIHIWHAFYDLAFGLSLDESERLIAHGDIEPTVQVFQAPGGAITKKAIYKFYYHHAYPLGETSGEIRLIADSITDKNGHILPYVRFAGGSLTLEPQALDILDALARRRGRVA